jgi:hypothetical protein
VIAHHPLRLGVELHPPRAVTLAVGTRQQIVEDLSDSASGEAGV